MSEKRTAILICSILVVLIAATFAITLFRGNIPKNPEDTIGNTAGNLNNKGLFCENEGLVYFANSYDNNSLYVMNADETNMKKLNSVSVESINVGGDYIYYSQTDSSTASGLGFMRRVTGIYRTTKDGDNTKSLQRDPVVMLLLSGNHLYYQRYDKSSGVVLSKISTDGKVQTEISPDVINPASCQNGVIYFNGTEGDHYLYSLDTSTDAITTVWEGNLWNPVVQGNYVYYMDIANDYRLCRYSLTEGTEEVLTNDRIDMFNIYNDIIYYQLSSATDAALKRINIDGTNEEIVTEGVYHHINITPQYVYFQAYGDEITTYRTPTYGTINVSPFSAAEEVAKENL